MGKNTDRTFPSDHVLIALPDFRVIDADVLIVSETQRAGGGNTIEFGFAVPHGAEEMDYVCILAKLRRPARQQITLPGGVTL